MGGRGVSNTPMGQRHRVVIVGSGFGGLFAAKHLAGADVDVTLISRIPDHLFQPLLYQVATGILSEGEIAPATRDILRKQRNARVLLGDVSAIDVDARTVTSAARGVTTVTPYDSLVVAAGADTSYFGHDEFAAFAPGLKSVDDALALRGRIFTAFEVAELEPDARIRKELLTFVVVGGGPTGVEMAGQILEASRRTLRDDFRSIDPTDARVILIDALGNILGTFGHRLSALAARQLTDLGIEVWLNAKVVGIDARGVDLIDDRQEKHRVATRCIVWAAGVQASPLARQLGEQTGATVDRAGRVEVRPDLTLPGHPEVFVVGDMASLSHYPGVAQVALQGAKYAAERIKADRSGRAHHKPFKYFDKGSMATISRFRAVASVGPLRFGGLIAWLLWLVIHIFYLVGFKNRVTTLLHWSVSFLGNARSQRSGPDQQAAAVGPVVAAELDLADAHPGPPVGTPPAGGPRTAAADAAARSG